MNEISPAKEFRLNKSEEERWTTDIFGIDSAPVPVTGCTSQEYFEQEMETLFKKVWVPVGRQEEVANPGDYFVFELECVNSSAVIVRGRDNLAPQQVAGF